MCLRVRYWQDGGWHILYGVSVWTWHVSSSSVWGRKHDTMFILCHILTCLVRTCQNRCLWFPLCASLPLHALSFALTSLDPCRSFHLYDVSLSYLSFVHYLRSPFTFSYFWSFLPAGFFRLIICDAGHAGSSLNLVAVHALVLCLNKDSEKVLTFYFCFSFYFFLSSSLLFHWNFTPLHKHLMNFTIFYEIAMITATLSTLITQHTIHHTYCSVNSQTSGCNDHQSGYLCPQSCCLCFPWNL